MSEFAEYLRALEPDAADVQKTKMLLGGASLGYVSATVRTLRLIGLEVEYIPDLTECVPDPDEFYQMLIQAEGELADMALGNFVSISMIRSCEPTVIEALRRRQASQSE